MVRQIGPNTIALPIDAISVTLKCEKGHQEQGHMTVLLNTETGKYNCTGGSSWDFCEACGLECDLDKEDDCYKDGCNHSHRSDESREAGHILVAQEVEKWWAENG